MFNKRDDEFDETGNSNVSELTPVSYNRPPAPAPGGPGGDAKRRDIAGIGASIRINGDLQGDEDLQIQGEVHGTVHLKNNALTVGEQGSLQADVYAKTITVEGTMQGDLYGLESVNIRASAQVSGNVVSPRVSLEDGAKFKGSIEMDPEALGDVFKDSRAGAIGAASAPSTPSIASNAGGASATDDEEAAKPHSASAASS